MPDAAQHEKTVSHRPQIWLWLSAIALFALGDAVTTHYGLLWGAYEANRTVLTVVDRAGVAGIISIKALVCGVAYAAYRLLPSRHAVGIPMGLSLLGSAVVTWNLAILVVLA